MPPLILYEYIVWVFYIWVFPPMVLWFNFLFPQYVWAHHNSFLSFLYKVQINDDICIFISRGFNLMEKNFKNNLPTLHFEQKSILMYLCFSFQLLLYVCKYMIIYVNIYLCNIAKFLIHTRDSFILYLIILLLGVIK